MIRQRELENKNFTCPHKKTFKLIQIQSRWDVALPKKKKHTQIPGGNAKYEVMFESLAIY